VITPRESALQHWYAGNGSENEGDSAMELAIVIVVVIVAGAMIPGNPEIHFFH
jgi:hypothetical protein